MKTFEDKVLLSCVLALSVAMAWIALPFYSAILWALVVAIVFAPVNQRLMLAMPKRQGTATMLTLVLIIAMVIIPAAILATLLVEEAADVYLKLQAKQINLGKVVDDMEAMLPAWAQVQLDKFGFGDINAIQRKLSTALSGILRFAAGQAISVGQGAFGFMMQLGIMLYLTFFLLRDGRALTRVISSRIPLHADQKTALFEKFITVIRATIKGSLVVAIVQGLIGGITFKLLGINGALLWGVVMAFLSLIPAVGTGLIWVPAAIYLLATGSIWQGVTLTLCGIFIISMVDNVLRPILVGKDTRMPDYVVLIATLGGLSVFGMNGIILGPVIAAMFMVAWEIFGDTRAARS
jgi:predicted PurR-regulated permease PerM